MWFHFHLVMRYHYASLLWWIYTKHVNCFISFGIHGSVYACFYVCMYWYICIDMFVFVDVLVCIAVFMYVCTYHPTCLYKHIDVCTLYTNMCTPLFIHSGDLYSASSRDYYSEAFPAQCTSICIHITHTCTPIAFTPNSVHRYLFMCTNTCVPTHMHHQYIVHQFV